MRERGLVIRELSSASVTPEEEVGVLPCPEPPLSPFLQTLFAFLLH